MRNPRRRRRIPGGTAWCVAAALSLACGGRSDLSGWEDSGGGGVEPSGGAGGSGGWDGWDGGGGPIGTGGAPTGGAGGDSGGTAGSGGSAPELCTDGFWQTDLDQECVAWTVCAPGTFVSTPGTSSHDRVCESCPSSTFSTADNLSECEPWTECSLAETALVPGSNVTDTTCQNITPFGFADDAEHYGFHSLAANDTTLFAAGVDVTPQLVLRAALYAIPRNGSEVSSERFGLSATTFAFGVAVLEGDRLAISGTTRGSLYGTLSGEADAFVRVDDDSGNTLWAAQFGSPAYENDIVVAAGPSGSVYVGGWTEGSVDAPLGGASDSLLRKYDADGAVEWAKQLDLGDDEELADVAADGSGNVYVAGAADSEGYLLAFAADGALLWQLGAEDVGCSHCSALFAAADGDLYVAGLDLSGDVTGVSVSLARVSPSGSVAWKAFAPPPSGLEEIVTTLIVKDDTVYVFGTGVTLGDANHPDGEALVVTFATDGEYVQREVWGGTAYETIEAAVLVSSGDIFIAGTVSWWDTNFFRGYVLPWAPPAP